MIHNILRRILWLQAGLLAASLMIYVPVASGVAKGYRTVDTGLSTGMIVALASDEDNQSFVERASPENISRVIGVVVDPSANFANVGSAESDVFVEASEEVEGYVSDLNGKVAKGDRLTVSPLKGILMKASLHDMAVATALEDFDGEGESVQITGDNGSPKTVTLLRLAVNISARSGGAATTEDSAISRLGQAIVDKDVTELQVIIAVVIFFMMVVVEGSIIYAAISSGIIALGRNPMAKNLIRRELIRMVGVAVFVLMLGLAAIYAVLWA